MPKRAEPREPHDTEKHDPKTDQTSARRPPCASRSLPSTTSASASSARWGPQDRLKVLQRRFERELHGGPCLEEVSVQLGICYKQSLLTFTVIARLISTMLEFQPGVCLGVRYRAAAALVMEIAPRIPNKPAGIQLLRNTLRKLKEFGDIPNLVMGEVDAQQQDYVSKTDAILSAAAEKISELLSAAETSAEDPTKIRAHERSPNGDMPVPTLSKSTALMQECHADPAVAGNAAPAAAAALAPLLEPRGESDELLKEASGDQRVRSCGEGTDIEDPLPQPSIHLVREYLDTVDTAYLGVGDDTLLQESEGTTCQSADLAAGLRGASFALPHAIASDGLSGDGAPLGHVREVGDYEQAAGPKYSPPGSAAASTSLGEQDVQGRPSRSAGACDHDDVGVLGGGSPRPELMPTGDAAAMEMKREYVPSKHGHAGVPSPHGDERASGYTSRFAIASSYSTEDESVRAPSSSTDLSSFATRRIQELEVSLRHATQRIAVLEDLLTRKLGTGSPSDGRSKSAERRELRTCVGPEAPSAGLPRRRRRRRASRSPSSRADTDDDFMDVGPAAGTEYVRRLQRAVQQQQHQSQQILFRQQREIEQLTMRQNAVWQQQVQVQYLQAQNQHIAQQRNQTEERPVKVTPTYALLATKSPPLATRPRSWSPPR